MLLLAWPSSGSAGYYTLLYSTLLYSTLLYSTLLYSTTVIPRFINRPLDGIYKA